MKVIILLACAVAYVASDATSDCIAQSKDCPSFFQCCESCKGGYSAGCGIDGTSFSTSYTHCNCDNWDGVKPPKVEQDDATFLKDALDQHNIYRAKHNAGPLQVDSDAENTAQNWANHLASTDTFEHNANRGNYGENIFRSWGSTVEGKDAVISWYDEVTDPGYDFNNQGFSGGTGHFTQVVWKGTTAVGCGRATSGSGYTYVVCDYSPPGNMLGEFEKNVFPAAV